jgi:amino acid transporter
VAGSILLCGAIKLPARRGRVFSVRASIAPISLAAVLTLRGMPTVAEYGWSSIAFYVLGTLFVFIPLALVSAELATGWPRAGGLYAWVKLAFGERSGFLAVWFEWVENIVWFRTVLSFVAATLTYVIDPSLADNEYSPSC